MYRPVTIQRDLDDSSVSARKCDSGRLLILAGRLDDLCATHLAPTGREGQILDQSDKIRVAIGD